MSKPKTLSFTPHLSHSWVLFLVKGIITRTHKKLQAVKDWPTPTDRKKLQRFLGFVNFYRRFIINYSQITIPLTRLTSCKTQFKWTPEADQAFSELKKWFCSTPILHHTDPWRQFIVEVDASDTGARVVLSQKDPLDNKIHPCTSFFQMIFCFRAKLWCGKPGVADHHDGSRRVEAMATGS